jgi:hypothetical protein
MLAQCSGIAQPTAVSEPLTTGATALASETAPPTEDPPHVFVKSYGLRIAPKTLLNVCDPASNSGELI